MDNEMLTIVQDFTTPYMDRYEPAKRALLRTEECRRKHREYYQETRNAVFSVNPMWRRCFSGR